MKTIEEKAKAYDEAIKKAAALYKASEPMSGCNVIIETLFPELKESEDGKVEKAIFGMVYDSDNELWSSYDVSKSDVLAWLEKQGEKEKDILEDAILDGYILDDDEDGLIAETIRYKKEKQSEQKPNDKVEQRFKVKYAGSEYNVLEVKDIAGVTFYGIEDEPNHIDYVKEENCEIISGYAIKENGSPYPTKPAVFSGKEPAAWSEEDERIMNGLIDSLTRISLNTRTDSTSPNYTFYKEIDWLKSLRPQKCLIPSEEEIEKAAQEWDSKANFNPFYMTMENDKPTGVKQSITTHKESFIAGVNWILKFLRCWKPTDEQMIALRDVISGCSYDIEPLVELETKLKEL